jgi:hypothetical protein
VPAQSAAAELQAQAVPVAAAASPGVLRAVVALLAAERRHLSCQRASGTKLCVHTAAQLVVRELAKHTRLLVALADQTRYPLCQLQSCPCVQVMPVQTWQYVVTAAGLPAGRTWQISYQPPSDSALGLWRMLGKPGLRRCWQRGARRMGGLG